MKLDYKIISFLLSGKRRRTVLLSLKETKTPKQIAKDCKISISNVSISLSELQNKGLIKCLTPNEHIFRFYQITNKGREAIRQLEEYKKSK